MLPNPPRLTSHLRRSPIPPSVPFYPGETLQKYLPHSSFHSGSIAFEVANAFKKAKKELSYTLVLALHDHNQETTVSADVSSYELDAILL